jgi:hypothetical protein
MLQQVGEKRPIKPQAPHKATMREVVRMKARCRVVGAIAAGALLVGAVPAFANPSPPTNGGNGAGKSGQCTGANADRPSSCQSQGGPGNQP